MIQCLKNVSVAGGLLALGAAGPGAISVDARTARLRRWPAADEESGASCDLATGTCTAAAAEPTTRKRDA